MKMKRLFSLLLIAVLLVTCAPFAPLAPLTAEAATDSGTCGDNLTWSLNSSGTLTISGTGSMKSYSFSSPPWGKYADDIKKVVINYGATNITGEAFFGYSNLTSVQIPTSVTNIGYYAFASCESLTSVTIPDSVTDIGFNAFSICTSLTSVKIGNSVTHIGSNAFANCPKLTSVTIPESVIYINTGAFANCTSLTTIYFDGSAPSLAYSYALKDVTATAYYYPDATWTAAIRESMGSGGNITWVSRGCKHSYSSTITQPTCTAQGYTTHRCTKCGSSYKDSYTSAKGHSYGTWTKLNDTSHSRTCTVCKKVSETANHSWNSGVITKQAICSEDGVLTFTCSVCKGTKTETIPATGEHSYTSVVTPPTCTEHGFTTHTCSNCGDSYKDTYTKENGHSYGKWITVDGQTHKRTCTVCLLVSETEDHTYNPGTVKSPATCTEDEVRTYRCIYCEYERDVVIPDSATGHTYGDWEKVDETNHKHTCTVCKTHSETKEHTFGEDRVCTGCGYQDYILGDFTGDNEVTDADVIYLLWYTVFPEDYPLDGKLADFTGDNEVTDADVIYLLWHTVFPEDYPLKK